MDQNKLAELNAMATGGTTGLAQYQASQSGANDARSAALNSAAGFGQGTSFVSSAPLQSALSATASKYSAPGADYMSAVAAQGPGLDAASAAAASNWQNEKSSELQSELATSRAKIQAQTQADQQDQQNKLALLRLKSQEAGEQGQYQLQDLAVKNQALALDPQRVTGKALLGQQGTVASETQGSASSDLQSKIAKIQQGIGHAVDQGITQGPNLKALLESANQVQHPAYQPTASPNGTINEVPSGSTASGLINEVGSSSPAVSQDVLNRNQGIADLYGGWANSQGAIADLARKRSDEQFGQAQTDSFDLPKFQFQSAVAAGMDPTLAAGTYLANEDQYVANKQSQAASQEMLPDTLEARRADLEARKQRQADTADANTLSDQTGIDAQSLLNARTGTGLKFDDIKKVVSSDSWKEVQKLADQAGQIKNGADGKPQLDDYGHPVVYDFQDFAAALASAQSQGHIDDATANVAGYLFQRKFHVANSASSTSPESDPFAATAFGAG